MQFSSLIAHNTLTLRSLWTLTPFELSLINFVYQTGGWSYVTIIIMTLYYMVTVNRSGYVFVCVFLSCLPASLHTNDGPWSRVWPCVDDFTTFLLAHSVLKMPCDHQCEWIAAWMVFSFLRSYLWISAEEHSPFRLNKVKAVAFRLFFSPSDINELCLVWVTKSFKWWLIGSENANLLT